MRYELIATIILDSIVIGVAMLSRGGLLWLANRLPAEVRQDQSLHWLGALADWGPVAGAGAFTCFDLGRRVLDQVVDLLRVWRGRHPQPTDKR